MITYFGIAGRGEVARLYALVGGLDITYNTLTTGYKHKTPIGYLPALAHPEAGLLKNLFMARRTPWDQADPWNDDGSEERAVTEEELVLFFELCAKWPS